jgi:UDP:flavonoid glycosyltransferase YjiC (YdhE family)
VRVLVTTFPAVGHFHPIAPLCLALQAAGHDVLVATGPDLVGWVRRCGLSAVPAGLTQDEAVRRAQASVPAGRAFGPHMFAHVAPAPMLTDLVRLVQRWPPGLVVHEESEYVGPLLATVLDVPCVTHSWPAPARTDVAGRHAIDAVAAHWNQLVGQPARVTGDLYLDACPPALQSPEVRSIPAVMAVRPEPFDGPSSPARPHLHELARPAAYVTFGTVAEFARPDRLGAAARATAHEVATVVVTSGPNDPADIRAAQPNVVVERYIPQRQLLQNTDVVVSHGGAGSTVGALVAGLPQLVLPQGAPSQASIGERLSTIGAGLTIPAEDRSEDRIRSAVRRLLQDPSFTYTARQIAQELRLLPAPTQVAEHVIESFY